MNKKQQRTTQLHPELIERIDAMETATGVKSNRVITAALLLFFDSGVAVRTDYITRAVCKDRSLRRKDGGAADE
jgi:hypothetical protein